MSQPKNGVAFIAQIKREWPQIKVIVFTNYADTRYRHLCAMNGVDVFCDKASDSEALAETLGTMARLQNKPEVR
jgi:DNA-binding NarL/FixJ family response regulator